AADVAGNVESAPDVADAACGFSIPAAVDIDPDTLNLKGNGRWITAYIELPQGYDVRNVDISSIKLNNAVASESGQSYGFVKDPEIRDRNGNGLPELMVKFDRAAVQALASVGDVKLTVTGKWHAVLFEGSDNIRVIDPGRGQGSGNSHAVSHGHSGGNSGQGPPQTPPGQGGTPPGQSSNQNQGNNGNGQGNGNQGNQGQGDSGGNQGSGNQGNQSEQRGGQSSSGQSNSDQGNGNEGQGQGKNK
ncbi:MAG: hypothetical protein AB1305_05190, partial [Candidatus Hadarchaeota archaeon]